MSNNNNNNHDYNDVKGTTQHSKVCTKTTVFLVLKFAVNFTAFAGSEYVTIITPVFTCSLLFILKVI